MSKTNDIVVVGPYLSMNEGEDSFDIIGYIISAIICFILATISILRGLITIAIFLGIIGIILIIIVPLFNIRTRMILYSNGILLPWNYVQTLRTKSSPPRIPFSSIKKIIVYRFDNITSYAQKLNKTAQTYWHTQTVAIMFLTDGNQAHLRISEVGDSVIFNRIIDLFKKNNMAVEVIEIDTTLEEARIKRDELLRESTSPAILFKKYGIARNK